MKKLNIFLNRIKPFLSNAFEGFLSLIYKENCCICGCSKDNKILCKTCSKSVEILSGFAQGVLDGVEIYSACFYKDTIRTLIHKLKFNHKRAVARVLANILYNYFKKIIEFEQIKAGNIDRFQNAILVPVPTQKKNIKERGYNNVYEITKEFSNLSGLPFLDGFLVKIKNSKPQYKMNKNQRKSNVEGTFNINLKRLSNKEDLDNKTFVIIDDIITTGATLGEIIKVLKENGVKNIICITLSKAI